MRDIYLKKRILLYIPIILIVAVMQSVPQLTVEIFGVRPLLLIPLAVCLGMFEREVVGGYLGLFAGALWDISSLKLPGSNAIALLVIGVICGLLITNFMQSNLFSALILTAGASVVYAILDYTGMEFAYSRTEALYSLLHNILPQFIYTVICIIPIYMSMRFILKNLNLKLRSKSQF